MKPVSELVNSNVRFVFTDIDDTLTHDGRMVPEAFQALWSLFKNGINVVPVTGRPAGWCELIARQWPVAGVIGENGGLYFRLKNNEMKRHYVFDAAKRKDNQFKLEKIRAEVLASVPRSAVASDQFCRQMDLAIDFCEDVKPALLKLDVKKIVEIFERHGAVAKISSIHVNGWYGDYDKLSMCKLFVEKEFGEDLTKINDQALFVGDSPNDEPMFEFFNKSIGVANVKNFMKQLKHPPKFITESEDGLGFAEVANKLFL